MDMTFSEIQAEITEIETRLKDLAPGCDVQLHISSGRPCVYMNTGHDSRAPLLFDGERCCVFYSDDVRSAIKAARDKVLSIPDRETVELRNFQRELAKVIDKGHALNLPDDVMDPLRQGSQAMTENLLTHEGGDQ